jgi:hypothetical protein
MIYKKILNLYNDCVTGSPTLAKPDYFTIAKFKQNSRRSPEPKASRVHAGVGVSGKGKRASIWQRPRNFFLAHSVSPKCFRTLIALKVFQRLGPPVFSISKWV